MTRNSSSLAVLLAVPLAGLIALFAIERLWINNVVTFVHANAFWLLPVAVVGIGFALLWDFVGFSVPIYLGWLLVAVGVIWFGYNVATNGYNSSREYLDAVEITSEEAQTYEERAAYVVANAQAPSNLDIRGDIIRTKFVPGQDKYTSLVSRPGSWSSFNGYAGVLSQEIELTGQATGGSCEFSTKATDRLGGYLWNSLEREIIQERFGTIIDDRDAYGACLEEDGEQRPVVIVPLKQLRGVLPAIEVPAGVAVYDGLTGELDILDEVEAGELPGAVFPLSVAENMREATAATGTWWEYMRGRNGYESTEGDPEDPNGSNGSEFLMSRKDGTGHDYVTPLTLRGRSNFAIGAVSAVPAGEVTAGELPVMTVHELETHRRANSAVADRLKTDYSDLPDWASGMRIFEITPVSPGEWVASLGQEQNVAYRVRIAADGDSCLETADGEELRCGRATATDGNGPGVALAPGGDRGAVSVPQDGNLSGLSDTELATLLEQASRELADRLNTADQSEEDPTDDDH